MAGSFTLDSFGDAYIDSIEGAPERHHRFEPTVGAQVDVGFGIDWSDLWNMTSGESVPASVVVSKALSSRGGNVHQSGDGWVDCVCGRKHGDTNGAAGVLLARRDPKTGQVTHIVMQRQTAWSAEGGTWAIPMV